MVEIQLAAKIREDQYIAFGLSGSNNHPKMVSSYKTSYFFVINIKYYDI